MLLSCIHENARSASIAAACAFGSETDGRSVGEQSLHLPTKPKVARTRRTICAVGDSRWEANREVVAHGGVLLFEVLYLKLVSFSSFQCFRGRARGESCTRFSQWRVLC